MSSPPARVERVTSLAAVPLSRLLMVGLVDGHSLVQRLCDDWRSGANRFDRQGEALFVAWRGARLAGVCGLNRDPFSDARPDDARLRHLYVEPAARRAGVGRELSLRCIDHARDGFARVRLRCHRPAALALYRTLGFAAVGERDATHALELGA
jgi:GNAT superfamily N-acetyltransferase